MGKNIFNRQDALVAMVEITPDTVAEGFTIALPRGAYVTNVQALKQTAFNTGGTTPAITLKLHDGAASLISDEVLTGTGAITVDTAAKFYPNGATLTGTIAESAASGLVHATAGQAVLAVSYVQLGRGGEIQDV